MRRTSLVLGVLLLAVVVLADRPASYADGPARNVPGHHLVHGFRNIDPAYAYPISERVRRLVHGMSAGWPERGTPIKVVPNDGAELRANGVKPTLTWVGHATFLVQLGGVNIVTDPTWADRASPLSFAGPHRLVPPGIRLEDLPHIDAVIVSHDHYDHLDGPTVRRLVARDHPRFFVPLGMKPLLADFGATDVVELDWWESADFRGVTFTATPAQHSSGRGMRDQNLRLWASWVIAGAGRRLFFAGDTGYFRGFKEIGERFGPFDVAAVPIGGYSSWQPHHPNHLNPEEAVQVFEDVHARRLVPMHWGTFDMNKEPFREPPTRLHAEAVRRGIDAEVSVLSPGQEIAW